MLEADWSSTVGHLWRWLLSHLSLISAVVAVIAVIVSLWAIKYARRAATAAEAQARATEEQAEHAFTAILDTRKAAEVSALTSIRSAIEASAPRPVVALEAVPWPPLRTDTYGEEYRRTLSIDHGKPLEDELDFSDNRLKIHLIHFLIKGTIYNDGNESMQVLCDGVKFVKGRTLLASGELDVPIRSHLRNPRVVIYADQSALFQFSVCMSVYDWLNLQVDADGVHTSKHFIVLPGSRSEPATLVDVKVRGEAIRVVTSKGRDYIRLNNEDSIELSIDYRRSYHRSLAELHADLIGDEDAYFGELKRQRRSGFGE